MAQPVTIKGGKVKVLLGSGSPVVFAAPCGLTSKSVTLNKGLEEVNIPDCADPDAVPWLGRDATSLSMSISGEGVLASESVETWLEAFESVESVPVQVVWEFPAKTITWEGNMHVESIETTGENGRRVTMTVSLQSDGLMERVEE